MSLKSACARLRSHSHGSGRTLGFLAVVMLALFLSLSATPVRADDGESAAGDPLTDVRFDQNFNAQVPLDLTFADEKGSSVRLGDFLGNRPILIQLAYYRCPMLCGLVFQELASKLSRLEGVAIGRDFDVLSVSIDPDETPADAAAKKRLHVGQVGRPGAEDGWHFLTGRPAAIEQLAQTIGFQYVYDQEREQYAHPTGVVILTPEGRIAHYLLGIEFSPRDLRLGLVQAAAGEIGSPVDQLLLLCYRYDPVTGRYTVPILNLLRVAGFTTTAVLGVTLLYLYRRDGTGETGSSQDR